MMRFVVTYEDLRLLLSDYWGLDIQVYPYDATKGQLILISPAEGIRKLLPHGLLNHQQYFSIDEFDATSVTLYLLGSKGECDDLNTMFAKLINYYIPNEIEPLRHGRYKIHLDKHPLTQGIQLHVISLAEEGIVLECEDNPAHFEQMRMVQMLLRAGYKVVRIIPKEDMGYGGYWFSDDTLDYKLVITNHTADIRLWSSFQVMDWLGLEGELNADFFEPAYPNEEIEYRYGKVSIGIPLTIAEAEINAQTLERNCERLKSEIAINMTNLFYYATEKTCNENEPRNHRT